MEQPAARHRIATQPASRRWHLVLLGGLGISLLPLAPTRAQVPKDKVMRRDTSARVVVEPTDSPAVFGRDTTFLAAPPCDDAVRVHIGGREDTVAVPPLVGLRDTAVYSTLRRVRLIWDGRSVPSSQPINTIIGQAPPAGTRVALGSRIKICWAGPEARVVPNVTGFARARAIRALKDSGYAPVMRDTVTLETAKDGRVVTQDPAGGRVATNPVVTVVIGVLMNVTVPSVRGLTAAVAGDTLKRHYLASRREGRDESGAIVDSQVPAAGSKARAWTVVRVIMAAPPRPPEEQPPTGGEPRSRLPWIILAIVVGTSAIAAAGRVGWSQIKLHAIQIVPAIDLGTQTLRAAAADDSLDAELDRLGFEIGLLLDAGVQALDTGATRAEKEVVDV